MLRYEPPMLQMTQGEWPGRGRLLRMLEDVRTVRAHATLPITLPSPDAVAWDKVEREGESVIDDLAMPQHIQQATNIFEAAEGGDGLNVYHIAAFFPRLDTWFRSAGATGPCITSTPNRPGFSHRRQCDALHVAPSRRRPRDHLVEHQTE